jgi:hypothetical protein
VAAKAVGEYGLAADADAGGPVCVADRALAGWLLGRVLPTRSTRPAAPACCDAHCSSAHGPRGRGRDWLCAPAAAAGSCTVAAACTHEAVMSLQNVMQNVHVLCPTRAKAGSQFKFWRVQPS